MKVCCYLHHPGDLSRRSGMYPLVEALGAQPVFYGSAWWTLEQRAFWAGHLLRRVGIAYFGSAWNTLVPVYGEYRLRKHLPEGEPHVAHFIWAEFASPRRTRWFRGREGLLVGTFHASATRLPEVLSSTKRFQRFDGVTLMSRVQEAFFLEQGVPPERICTILHGVDLDYFTPDRAWQDDELLDGALEGFLIGVTERDHPFMAEVMRKLPNGVMTLSVATSAVQAEHYRGIANVRILPRLSDEELVQRYQRSHVLAMPMIDCCANNSILESMACGTPVLTNRIGGIPEYVDEESNIVLPAKVVDDWVEAIKQLARDREALAARRQPVRRWAARFDWHRFAEEYHAFYRSLWANRRVGRG